MVFPSYSYKRWTLLTRKLVLHFSGTRCMVDSWLVAHALPPGINANTLHHVDENDEDEELCQLTQNDLSTVANSSADQQPSGQTSTVHNRAISCSVPVGGSSGSKNSSGSGTPVRKISAHEFERGGLTKPLVTTVDGTPTFLSPPNINSEFANHHLIRKRSRNDIQGLNETDLILGIY